MRALMLAGVLVSVSGCATYETAANAAVDRACSPTGQTAREAFKAARRPSYLERDQALCLRCPGEDALQCTGDPKALP